jgi:hypothetical protein
MPKYKHGAGSVYKRGRQCWISYYVNGERVREAANTTNEAEARRKLKSRQGEVADGRFIGPAADRVTFTDLAHDFLNDYRIHQRKSIGEAERRVRLHLAPFFAGKTAHAITTTDIRAFVTKRQEEHGSNGEINRELAALKRMFNLALRAEKITRKPHIDMLEENNVRQGFFEVTAQRGSSALSPWIYLCRTVVSFWACSESGRFPDFLLLGKSQLPKI